MNMQAKINANASPTIVASNKGLLQRKCACGGAAGMTGECEGCRKKKLAGGALQKKLTVNEPGDKYEQEADRVADAVTRMSDSDTQLRAESTQDTLARKPQLGISRYSQSEGGSGEAPPIVHDVLNSPGQPLDASTRAFMEPRFGYDFSGVRVHSDVRAAKSARAINALAYSVGNNVVFRDQQYSPSCDNGRRLLAHELTHVVQTGHSAKLASIERNKDYADSLSVRSTNSISSRQSNGDARWIQRQVSDDRSDRRDRKAENRSRETLGEREGGRGRRRVTGGDLDSDWAGRALLMRYLRGGGDWTIVNDTRWSDYMKANELLRRMMVSKVFNIALEIFKIGVSDKMATQAIVGPVYKNMEILIDNGESMVGYQYLHGTERTVGGFDIYGAFTRFPEQGGATIVLDMNYTWNDIIDPNPEYGTDTVKSIFAELITLGNAESYNFHLTWSAPCIVVLNKSGHFESYRGWPFSRPM